MPGFRWELRGLAGTGGSAVSHSVLSAEWVNRVAS